MKPTLLILAAGIGSRYGSLKQIDRFGPSGETLTDYSVYDAVRAGFGKIVFIISPSMEKEFSGSYIKRFTSIAGIDYVTQSIQDIPSGLDVPPGRTKPWGTAHAVLRAAGKIREPFAVINADDFYGMEAYRIVASFLQQAGNRDINEFCLAGYPIRNTLSPYGTVSRGVCVMDQTDYLESITERTKIRESGGKVIYLDQEDKEFEIDQKSLVSMNLFGFTPAFFKHLENQFLEFISAHYLDLRSELYLPAAVDSVIRNKLARVKVLRTDAIWFGVTYKEDKPFVMKMILDLIKEGRYPVNLWKTL